jgi:hypothetical protein
MNICAWTKENTRSFDSAPYGAALRMTRPCVSMDVENQCVIRASLNGFGLPNRRRRRLMSDKFLLRSA